jgi:uncharacterized membrane protein YfcA
VTDQFMLIAIVTGLAFLLAGFVKGVIGMGLPTVAIGLLGLVMLPGEAAALLIIPSMVTNLWQLAIGPGIAQLLRRLWPMLAGICLGTLAGGWLLGEAMGGSAKGWLGAALMIYAVIGLLTVRFSVSARVQPLLSPIVGVATGLVTGATGVFVLPAVPYLQALEFERDELIQALGLSFTVSTLALAGNLLQGGVLGGAILIGSLLALLPALGGMLIGQWARSRISPAMFRRCFFIGLLVLGGDLMIQAAL